MDKRKVRAILVIALCLLLTAFGVFDQIRSIQTANHISDVLKGVEEGNG